MIRISRYPAFACLLISVSACSEAEQPQRSEDSGPNSNGPGVVVNGGNGSGGGTTIVNNPPANTDDSKPPASSNGGSGGSGGTGNSSADGGVAGSPSAGDGGMDSDPIQEPAKIGDFAVLCEDGNGGQTSTPQFTYNLYLVNKTDEDVPLDEITVRYFFTADEDGADEHRVFFDYAGPDVGSQSNLSSSIEPFEPAQDDADSYIEIGFADGELEATPESDPDWNARIIKLRVQIQPTALRYDLTNDYSFTPSGDGKSPCEKIVMYRNGRIIFGVQPDGVTVEEPMLPDGGVGDAGPPNAVDAGVEDAGSEAPDASMTPDAGAGGAAVDAGASTDGGAADASAGGATDAG